MGCAFIGGAVITVVGMGSCSRIFILAFYTGLKPT